MKITSVETLFVRIPMSFRYSGGAAVADGRSSRDCSGSLIVKVHTDEGITGLGDVIVKSGRERPGGRG